MKLGPRYGPGPGHQNSFTYSNGSWQVCGSAYSALHAVAPNAAVCVGVGANRTGGTARGPGRRGEVQRDGAAGPGLLAASCRAGWRDAGRVQLPAALRR